MKINVTLRLICLISGLSGSFGHARNHSEVPDPSHRNRTLIIFFDGLRPDYITPSQMPNLYAFKQKAAFGRNHHSVFPTVTRVNSASYATGSYPGTHGILGNAVYFPEVNQAKALGTTYADLTKIAAAVKGPLLTAVSLGEVLHAAGERMMVFSSGTTGQAYLQNHTVSGGAVLNPDLILPESFKQQVFTDIGPVATLGDEDENRHTWITDGYLTYGLAEKGPLVSAVWYSDPDGAAHSHGIGSPEAVKAIKYVDGQFGRILDAIREKGWADSINILISADHGFVTHVGTQNLTDFLIAEGLKKDKTSEDVVVAEGAIYVKDHEPALTRQIVAALHQQEWVGAVFTRSQKPGEEQGWVPGTFSFDAIQYHHPERAGDILVAVNWNDAKNQQGYAGTDYAGGVAGHGGSSPHEITIALMAQGPDFKENYTSDLPTSNVDIMPTLLSIYHLPAPDGMDGRVVQELLKRGGKSPGKLKKEILRTEVRYPWGTYTLRLVRSKVGTYRYLDYTKVERRVSN